jgi:acetyl-CoA acyltransferase
MKQAVVVACARTPIGRAHKKQGYYREVRADDLATGLVRALIERARIDPAIVEDLLIGVTGQRDEQGFNVARMIGLMAGLPFETGATTINRLCGSSLQALNQAAHAIMVGAEDVQIVGGVEHMFHVPMETCMIVNPHVFERMPIESLVMGNTAEALAKQRGITRTQQDEYAVGSHQKAHAAVQQGKFKREIVPTAGHKPNGEPMICEIDQCIRPDTNLESLGELATPFQPDGGSITAGNSSPLNDGAAAMLVMSSERAEQLGLKPLARVVSTAVVGVDPRYMGIGPIPATHKALARAGLSIDDIDLVELNEAFAVQAIVCANELGINPAKLNVHGGAIALGHPLGASGARIATTLIHALHDRGARYGLATMCIGVGQGIATIFERVE